MTQTLLLAALLITGADSEPWARHTIDASSRGADGVRIADADGDGRLDLVTGWEEGGQVRLYLQPPADEVRRPWPAVTVGRVKSPEDAVLADLDGDGRLDVVSCCEGNQRTVYIHWSPEREKLLDENAWTTTPLPCTAFREQWMFALPLSVSGDPNCDLIVGSKGAQASVSVLLAPDDARNAAAWRKIRWYNAGWIMSLVAVDMDADGDQDVLVSDRKGSKSGVFWLENPGVEATRQGRVWQEFRIGGSGKQVMFLATSKAGPLRDIFVATHHSTILHFRGIQPRWVERTLPNPFEMPHGKAVALGDMDGDGDIDLVHTTEQPRGVSGVSWLEQGPNGFETAHVISGPEGQKFDLVQLVDLDQDGDLDVIACEESDNLGVVWYENPRR